MDLLFLALLLGGLAVYEIINLIKAIKKLVG